MRIWINDIAYYSREKLVANEGLHKENPFWKKDIVKGSSGVLKRYIAHDTTTAQDLVLEA